MRNLFDISNRVVVITGGTGVLGSCMAEYLAEQGAKVVVLGRSIEKGMQIESSLRSKGYEVKFIQTNVNDKAKLEENEKQILELYGQIDVLINGAGGNQAGATISPDKTLFDLQTEALQGVIDLNLMGTILPSIVFSKSMVEKGKGNIINISSEAAFRPLTRVVGYSAAKAAIGSFTQSLAIEMATKFGSSFRVNALAPGFFVTEQNRSLLTNPDGSFTDRGNTIIAHTPFKRFGNPEELLGTLHWLVSDASNFVTGTTTLVDGGFNAFCI